jgi:metal-dependent hydrolase (beta-lactamase superfamily II)
MGGFHLAGKEYVNHISLTIADLESINPNYIITGHCTARQAQIELAQVFGDKHIPYGVCTAFRFLAEQEL